MTSDDLRDLINDALRKVLDAEITPTQANAACNLVGKYLNSIKLEMEYYRMKHMEPHIQFLESSSTNKPVKKKQEE